MPRAVIGSHRRQQYDSFSCFVQVLDDTKPLSRAVVMVVTDGILTRSHDLCRCLKKKKAPRAGSHHRQQSSSLS